MQNIHAMTMSRGVREASMPGSQTSMASRGGRAARGETVFPAIPASLSARRHAQRNAQGDAPVSLSLWQFILILAGLSALGLAGGAWLAARLFA